MAIINGETFENMSHEMHAEDEFEACTFNGSAERCNFYKAIFDENCVFGPGFQFKSSNLQQAEGVEAIEKVDCLYITEAEWAEFVAMQRIRNPGMMLDE